MNRLRSLLKNLRRRDDALLDEELRFTLDFLTQEKIAQGVDPIEARRRSLVELGGLEQVRLQVKEVKMGASIEMLMQDIRFALRTLSQSKMWTTVIVLSLGFGIGMNTLMFSLVNGLFLRSVNVAQPGSLVRLRWAGPPDFTGIIDITKPDPVTGHDLHSGFSRTVWQRLRDSSAMPDLIATALQQVIVFANGESQWADGLTVSGNYYTVLGVRPFLGRLLTPDDDRNGAPPVAVISYDYWSARFGRDSNIIGKTITANDTPVTIVGVTPRDFRGIQSLGDDGQDITFPVELSRLYNPVARQNPNVWMANWSNFGVQLIGRLPQDLSAAQMQASLTPVFRDAARQSWNLLTSRLTAAQQAMPQFQNKTQPPGLTVESGRRGLNDIDDQTVRSGQILLLVVILLLVIVCANVANLMLSRAAARRREVSIRMSMGATRGRLIRQLLTESLLLAIAGGGVGLAINHWGRQIIPTFRSATVAFDMPIVNVDLLPALDWRVFAFVVGLTLSTAFFFGLFPALQTTRVNLSSVMKQQSRSVSGTKTLMSRGLLISQVAISTMLLVGAGLLLRTLTNLRGTDLGFNPENVVTFHLSTRAITGNSGRQRALYDHIMQTSRSLPGVRSFGGTSIAFWQSKVFGSVRVAVAGSAESSIVDLVGITPGFFQTMQMPIVSGRDITDQDMTAPARVVLINEAARTLFPDGQPLGVTFTVTGQDQNWEVVGIVGNVKFGSVREPARPLIFLPSTQTTFVLRTDADMKTLAPAIRKMVQEVEPMVPVTDIISERELIEARLQPERLMAGFYVVFGTFALLLASIGLFGLMSYNVARRTSEIGVRVALGARRFDVVSLVMRESLALVSIGILIGSTGALVLGRWIASHLYGLRSFDGVSLSVAILIMAAVSLLASCLPALRASRIDPIVALRHD